ncbi:hypothetical protein AB1Y20_000230 [Prymnesium parvum]|uniref:Uncharacterized protein n=1 Tax=Prymnesium parvum TaxID=97485 RepID=A0AB34K8T0_PRYPA
MFDAFLAAAEAGNAEELRLLASAGAEVNCTGPDGSSALLLAALGGHHEACVELLRLGADVHHAKSNGATAIFAAAASDAADCIQALHDAGAKLDAPNAHGVTPMQMAAHKNNAASVALLLRLRADATAADNAGNSAVHKAARSNAADALAILLDPLGDVEQAEDKQHEGAEGTPAREAAAKGTNAAGMAALEAALKATNSAGMTPLEVAVHAGACACAIRLLQACAAAAARPRSAAARRSLRRRAQAEREATEGAIAVHEAAAARAAALEAELRRCAEREAQLRASMEESVERLHAEQSQSERNAAALAELEAMGKEADKCYLARECALAVEVEGLEAQAAQLWESLMELRARQSAGVDQQTEVSPDELEVPDAEATEGDVAEAELRSEVRRAKTLAGEAEPAGEEIGLKSRELALAAKQAEVGRRETEIHEREAAVARREAKVAEREAAVAPQLLMLRSSSASPTAGDQTAGEDGETSDEQDTLQLVEQHEVATDPEIFNKAEVLLALQRSHEQVKELAGKLDEVEMERAVAQARLEEKDAQLRELSKAIEERLPLTCCGSQEGDWVGVEGYTEGMSRGRAMPAASKGVDSRSETYYSGEVVASPPMTKPLNLDEAEVEAYASESGVWTCRTHARQKHRGWPVFAVEQHALLALPGGAYALHSARQLYSHEGAVQALHGSPSCGVPGSAAYDSAYLLTPERPARHGVLALAENAPAKEPHVAAGAVARDAESPPAAPAASRTAAPLLSPSISGDATSTSSGGLPQGTQTVGETARSAVFHTLMPVAKQVTERAKQVLADKPSVAQFMSGRLTASGANNRDRAEIDTMEPQAVYNHAMQCYKSGRYSEAEHWFRGALHAQPAEGDQDKTVVILNNLAATLEKLNQPREAEALYCQAIAICEASIPVNHARTTHIRAKLKKLQENLIVFPGLPSAGTGVQLIKRDYVSE